MSFPSQLDVYQIYFAPGFGFNTDAKKQAFADNLWAAGLYAYLFPSGVEALAYGQPHTPSMSDEQLAEESADVAQAVQDVGGCIAAAIIGRKYTTAVPTELE